MSWPLFVFVTLLAVGPTEGKDMAACYLDAENVTVMEGTNGSAEIPVKCVGNFSLGWHMLIEYINVTAVAPSDYLVNETRIPIPTSARTFSFDVPIVNDDDSEEAETFTIHCSRVILPREGEETSVNQTLTNTTVVIFDDDERDPCETNNCSDGATCVPAGQNFTCSCPPGFERPICGDMIDPCETHNCSNGATCVPAGQNITCSCPPGFEGPICGEMIDPCGTHNCSNGATCVPAGQNITCSCPPGFEGPICGEIIYPCESDDCSDGATCVPAGQSFTCSCPPGFEGPICGETISNNNLNSRLMELTELLSLGNTTTKEVAEWVEYASGQDGFLEEDPANLDIVINSLEMITAAGDAMVTKPVVQIVNNLMGLGRDVLIDSTNGGGRVVAALEDQISNVQAVKGNFSAPLENLEIAAVKINRADIVSNISFASLMPLNSTSFDKWPSVHADGDDVPVNRTAVITIPADVLDLFTAGDDDPTVLPVSFFFYDNPVLFTPSSHGENQSRIISSVIGGSVSDGVDSSLEWLLNSSVITEFLTNIKNEEEPQCVHWSYDHWSMAGCKRLSNDQSRTVCSCKRLASFAILVWVRKGSFEDQVARYVITLIGSTISSLCLCVCLITFVGVRSYRTKQPTQIHFNLCLSLLGFYIAFMLGPLGTGKLIRCSVASAFIHFFSLATMAWMTAEAVNMYVLFVRLERTAIRHFVPVSCLLAYGLPVICTVVVGILNKDSDLGKAEYCFIHPGPALYYGFLTEVAVMLVVNLVIFALISRKVLCRPLMVSEVCENARRDEIIKRVRHGVLFWFILGLSWIFGALAILDGSTLIFDYLYTICVSLQGFVMFLLLCVANPEFRKLFTKQSQTENIIVIRDMGTNVSTPPPTCDTSFIEPATYRSTG